MSAITIVELKRLKPIVGASETDVPVAQFSCDIESSLNFRLSAVCSAVTVVSGISIQLQSSVPGGTFKDLGSVNATKSILANGDISLILNIQVAADQVDLPLNKSCRLVVTTGAGDTVTFDRITVQQG